MDWRRGLIGAGIALAAFGVGRFTKRCPSPTVEVSAARETTVSTKTAAATETEKPVTETKIKTVTRYLPGGERVIVREVERKASADKVTVTKASAATQTDRQIVTIRETPPQRPWEISALYGRSLLSDRTQVLGVRVARDLDLPVVGPLLGKMGLGPLRLGVEVQKSDDWAGLVTLGVTF